ncbi:MAG: bifunctional riboflavin kinase/FAD synthetase [Eubacteriaceae bacterium]
MINEKYGNEEIALALGFFDGVHFGHQVLLKETLNVAKRKKIKTGVMTFSKHPLELIFPNYSPWLITTNEEKTQLIKNLNIDYVFINDFTDELMRFTPEEFIVSYLLKKYNVKAIVVGFNYNFGYRGTGTVKTLKNLGEKYGFEVSVVDSYMVDEIAVSSTYIRDLISCGQVETVETFLGREYSITGKVITGKGLGKQYGIPTANIKLTKKRILPNAGVYYTNVIYKGKKFHGLTNLGFNPTFEKHPFSIETYIYDFDQDIYNEEITIIFKRKIRNEIKFENITDLIHRIKVDIDTIKKNYIK